MDDTLSVSSTFSNDSSSLYYDYNDDSISTISDSDLSTSLTIRSPPKYSVYYIIDDIIH